jgi:hypothetical protein
MRHALVIALSALCLLLARPARAQEQATTFEYTDLTTCAPDTAKDKADDAEEGSDEPVRCAGPGGEYSVFEY